MSEDLPEPNFYPADGPRYTPGWHGTEITERGGVIHHTDAVSAYPKGLPDPNFFAADGPAMREALKNSSPQTADLNAYPEGSGKEWHATHDKQRCAACWRIIKKPERMGTLKMDDMRKEYRICGDCITALWQGKHPMNKDRKPRKVRVFWPNKKARKW